MQKSLFAAVGLAVAATSFTAAAEAGPFDKIRGKIKKVEKKVEEVEEAVEDVEAVVNTVQQKPKARRSSRNRGVMQYAGKRRPQGAKRGAHKGVAGPAPAKFKSATKCANLGLGNAFIGQSGRYSFSEGISTQERTGVLNRRNVSPTDGCILPAMGVADILYVEVDKARYNGRGTYRMQCVSYDGSEQLNNTNAPRENNYTGKDVMLHSGNSTGYTPTATGSNGSRSTQYEKLLNSRGREMITFNMPELHSDSGTDFYCQHYNRDTGESALAFTYRRGPAG